MELEGILEHNASSICYTLVINKQHANEQEIYSSAG
jgi:hypothetical protein